MAKKPTKNYKKRSKNSSEFKNVSKYNIMFNFKHLKQGFDWYSEVKVKNNSTFAAELS